MLIDRARPSAVRVSTTLGVVLLCGLSLGSVMPRDMARQMELIDAPAGGIVVYGTITDTRADTVAGVEFPWTVLTVEVSQAIAPAHVPATVTVYSPGHDDHQLSISPSAEEVRKGEKVVLFLTKDDSIEAHAAGAFRLASYAEVFRVQTNRKGEVVVLGEGPGSAIPDNVKLGELAPLVAATYDAVVKAHSKKTK